MTSRVQRPWTGAELHRASSLWKAGMLTTAVAAEIGRHPGTLRHQIAARRDLFPRRRHARSEIRADGKPVQFKFDVSPFLHKAIKAEAKKRGVSQCMLIREALRLVFLTKRGSHV